MSVEYKEIVRDKVTGEFYDSLNETYQYFRNREKTSILGEGIKDILSDPDMFNEYVEKLTESISTETERRDVQDMMKNSKKQILTEASTSGIAPVSALTFPSLRVLWAKTGLVRVIPTEVVKSNSFTVSYNRPFIVGPKGEKLYLPEALDADDTIGDLKSLEKDPIELPIKNRDLLAEVGCSRETGDSIDRKFWITSVKINEEVITIKPNVGTLDINDKIYIECESSDGTVKDILFGNVDLYNGTMNLLSMYDNVKEVTIKGYVAADAHNHTTNISFEMTKRDCTIGTGEHFEASLPLEFLEDTMATYNIDGTSEVTDVMTNIIAQKLDIEIFKFIKMVYLGTNAKYTAKFDCRPPASYAMSPRDWREEMKSQIDKLATKLMTDTHCRQGYFVIVGAPIDVQLIPNVNWTFNHTVENHSGVDVTYNLGAMSGINRYTIVSFDLIPEGDMYILFVPTSPNQKSIVYYPYSFHVSDKYMNNYMGNAPSLTMFKRQSMEEFSPWVMRLTILNNNLEMLNNLPR